MSNPKILIVDDSQEWYQFILEVLESEKNLNIVAFAENGEDAVKKTAQFRPDLVLMDVSMPKMNGFEATDRICRVSRDTKVLFVSEHRVPELVQRAFDVGGSGYVLKSDMNTDLVAGMSAVLQGQRFVSRSLGFCRKDPEPKT